MKRATARRYTVPPVPLPAGEQRLEPDWDSLAAMGLDRKTRVWTFTPGEPWHNLPSSYNPSRNEFGANKDLCLICRTPGHERSGTHGSGLCSQHAAEMRRTQCSTLEQYLARDPQPLPTYGRCKARISVAAGCPRWADGKRGLCHLHAKQYRRHGCPDLAAWLAGIHDIKEASPGNQIDLSVLTDLQFEQVCWALANDRRENITIHVGNAKGTVKWLRDHTPGEDLREIDPSKLGVGASWLLVPRWADRISRHLMSHATELHADVIRLGIFSPRYGRRTADVSDISQPWLLQMVRDQLRHQAARGLSPSKLAETARAARWWSAYLRTTGMDAAPADMPSEVACDGFARWLQKRQIDSQDW
jgi:hypothetical protein